MLNIQARLSERPTIGGIDEERCFIGHDQSGHNTDRDADKFHEQRRYHCKVLSGILSSYAKLSIQRRAFRGR